MTFFYRARTDNPKVYMEPQKTPNSHINLEGKKKKAGDFILSDFTLYYKATVNKTVFYSTHNKPDT